MLSINGLLFSVAGGRAPTCAASAAETSLTGDFSLQNGPPIAFPIVWQNHLVTPMAEVVKEYLVPGSAWFLIIAGSVSTAWLFGTERRRRSGRTALASLVLMYWMMSLPVVAHALQNLHVPWGQTLKDALPDQPLPIVVLGNGLGGWDALGGRIEVPLDRTAMNTLFALDRFRRYPASTLIASGGSQPDAVGGVPEATIIADALRRNGVPVDRIVIEASSATTKEQADASSRLLQARGDRTCIVVTSPQQMSRAVDLFRRNGIVARRLSPDRCSA